MSWVVPSSVVWVEVELHWVELSWGWVGVEIELRLSLEVFELFNWSIWSLQLKYLKYFVPFCYFPGWAGGWVAVLSKNKAISASKLKFKISWVELRLSMATACTAVLSRNRTHPHFVQGCLKYIVPKMDIYQLSLIYLVTLYCTSIPPSSLAPRKRWDFMKWSHSLPS